MSVLDRVLHRNKSAPAAKAEPAPAERPAPPSPEQAERAAATVPGGNAASPKDIPKKGWIQIAKRGWGEAKSDNVPLLAAGVAFYAFLSIFPAIIAALLIYGLVSTPEDVTRQVESLGSAIPGPAAELLVDQGTTLAGQEPSSLGLGLVISVLLALWSASNGTGNLITAVNIAYDEEETRGFVKRKALALMLTVGAIVFVVIAVALIAVLPPVLDALGLSGIAWLGVQVARWVILLGAVTAALAILYRLAPDRDAPKMKWASVGAAIATVLWIIVSIGFSLYTAFGGYGSSYGSLAGVVVLLMWLWLTGYAILLGAEINAESEQQTVRDTTKGPEQPIGQRDAVKADSLPA